MAQTVSLTPYGPPCGGPYSTGDTDTDSQGNIWVCTSAGPPPAWAKSGVQAGLYLLDNYAGTDDQKMALAIAAVFAAGGGTIILSPRAHTFANQWATAYSAGVATALKIQGAGVAFNGAWGAPDAATTCTFTYSGAGAACIDMQHIGTIEISGIQFISANLGVPLLQTTNATPDIHDNVFSGGGTGITCATDAIVCGGTGTTVGAGDTAPYQGYMGDVYRNFFDGIRAGVICQTYANGVTIERNTWSVTCGSNSSAVGAITIAGTAGNSVVGVSTSLNLIEAAHYPYSIWADFCTGCFLAGDKFFDPTATTLAYIKFNSSSATENTVLAGYGTINGGTPAVVFVSQAARQNSIITSQPTNLTAARGALFANNPVIADFGLVTNGGYNGAAEITLGDPALVAGNIPTIAVSGGNPNTGGKTGTPGSVFISRANTNPASAFYLRSGAGTLEWYIPGTMFPVVTETASYAVLQDDYMIIMNGTSLTATLPAAANLAGKMWQVTNKNASALTVVPGSGTINGGASVTVAQWQTAAVRTDGTSFYASVS